MNRTIIRNPFRQLTQFSVEDSYSFRKTSVSMVLTDFVINGPILGDRKKEMFISSDLIKYTSTVVDPSIEKKNCLEDEAH